MRHHIKALVECLTLIPCLAVMSFAQFFGTMPLINVLSTDVSQMKFKWVSLRTVYSIFCCVCLIGYDVLTIKWVLNEGVEFSRCVTIIFYTSNVVVMMFFLRLAKHWPKIIRRWKATEDLMSPLLKERSAKQLKKKLIFLAILVMSLALSKPHVTSIGIFIQ